MLLFRLTLLAAAITSWPQQAAANEPLGFKSFSLGDSTQTIKRHRGVTCARPIPRSVPKERSKELHALAIKTAELEVIRDGDLVCDVRGQTIAGQHIEAMTLRLFSGRLLRIEISVKFPVVRHTRGESPMDVPQIRAVREALTERYGLPAERKQWIAEKTDMYVYSEWKLASGSIEMERREGGANAAKIVFSASGYDQAYKERHAAMMRASSALIALKLREAEEIKKKNASDL